MNERVEPAIVTEKEFLTVSQLNNLIQEVVHLGFPQSLWICGEVQGFDRNRDKRHIFFELCEKDPQTQDVLARIGLVIFSGRKAYIEDILKGAENAFQLKDDIEVKFLCRVDFYPPHGAVRLVVESIDPVYTLGKIAQEKQRLIALLRKNGTLDKNKALAFPEVPLRIGLITAFDSAAYNDFLSELKISGYGFRVFHRNAVMQGKKAEGDICRALDDLRRIKELDVVVVTRGGGSVAELSCFDSRAIAEKIAGFPWPVLSGIGHEINITVTDLAAHIYQKTPTAVARFLVERVEDFIAGMEEKTCGIIRLAQERFKREEEQLKGLALALQGRTALFLKAHTQQVFRFIEVVRRQPARILKMSSAVIQDRKGLLLKTLRVRWQGVRSQMQNYERLVDMASPQRTLDRGFSVTRTKDGRLLRSVKDVRPAEEIMTQLKDGRFESRVAGG